MIIASRLRSCNRTLSRVVVPITNKGSRNFATSTLTKKPAPRHNQRSWLSIIIPLTTCGVSGTAIYHYNDAALDHTSVSKETPLFAGLYKSLQSYRRLYNLLSTVVTICGDYGYHMYVRKHDPSRYDEVKTNLIDTQLLLDAYYNNSTRSENDEAAIAQLEVKLSSLKSELLQLSRKSSWHSIHLRNAGRLYRLCEANRGIYIKLGQHLGQLDYLLPQEYIDALAPLYAATPITPYKDVCTLFQQETGFHPEELFDTFQPTPIASASLAQVHRATKDNKEYAVKVQHFNLYDNAMSDLAAITYALQIVMTIFPQLEYKWLIREMSTNLPMELNFLHEAFNSQLCAALLRGNLASVESMDDLYDPNAEVVTPRIYHATEKILIMSFEEGVYVTNKAALQDTQLRQSDIANVIGRLFATQMYKSGFLHCDPHLANILVRPHPKDSSKPQIVLLDHGLYKHLSTSFRLDYCKLWRAMLLSKPEEMQRYCEKMNVGDLYILVAAMLTMKSWSNINRKDFNKLEHNHGENEIIKNYALRYLDSINSILNRAPSELLLVLKTNDCLRHLDGILGVPINSTIIITSILATVLLEEELKEARANRQWTAYLDAYWNYWEMMSRVLLFHIASYVLEVQRICNSWTEWMQTRLLYLW